MQVTCWELAKAVGLAIVQINATMLLFSIALGPLTQAYDFWQDYKESR